MSQTVNAAAGEEGPVIEGEALAAKTSLDPGFKRNILLIGGVALVAILAVLVLLLPSRAQSTSAGRADLSLGTSSTQTVDNLTPEMTKKLEAKQAEEAADAARRNQSYIPPDTSPVAPYAAPTGPGQSSFAQGTSPVTHTSANPEADNHRREGLMRQLGAMIEPTNEQAGVRQRVQREGGTATANASKASSSDTTTGTGTPARTLVPGLEISAAVLTNDMKVPANGSAFASARVTSGPAAGAFMIGQAKVVDEMLEVSFTQMRLDSKTYKIDAIVLDEKTASNAIEGNVDRRILARYVMPVALAVAQGFATAKAQTGSTVVIVGGSGAGVSAPAPTSAQATAAGVAAGMQIAAQETQKASQQPIVVSMGMNFPVGILFRAPVLEEVSK